MKKGILFALILLLSLGFVACTETTTTATETTTAETTTQGTTTEATTADTVGPVFSGVEDKTVYLNTTFSPLEGVTATDNIDGDVTANITVSGVVNTANTGTFFLKYSVTDSAGNKTEATRYITVEVDPEQLGDALIQNGDFSLGWAVWHMTTGNEGGAGTTTVTDGVLEVDVTAVSGGLWEPRLESNVIDFVQGTTYEVSFDAKAAAARSVHVQVGELLSSAPWFTDYKPGQTEIFDLSTDWQTFTFKFTMTLEDGPGQLLFEMGTVTGEVGTDNLITQIYYDNISIVEATPDPDTSAPTISGIEDVTLETGTAFDPLAGVTVWDNRDGAITIDSSNVTGTVDVNTPGDYTLTYTVTDEAGNTATEDRVVTVVDLVFDATGDVTDGSFDTTTALTAEVQDANNGYADITDPEIWYYYLADWDGAAATFNVTNGAAVIDITASGNNDWGIMLKQKGITLVLGETYKLTFTASSTVDRDMIAKVTNDYASTVSLTSTATTFEFIFTYEGANTTSARIMFLMGNTPAYAAGVVTIDDVSVSKLAQTGGETNGSFDQFGWSTWAQDWGTVGAISLDVVSGELVADVSALGESNWAVQLFQEGIVLVPGTTYTITFDAKSSVERDINLVLITDVENRQTFNLTTGMSTYTYTFTYNGTATTGKIDFEFGAISASSVAAVITLDNIAMTDGTNPVTIVNGGFDEVIGWGTWSHDSASTIELVGQELVVNVASTGSNNYDVQLFQNDIELVEGATYTIVFSVKADVARDIIYKIMTPGYNVRTEQTVSVTTDWQTFSFTFTYDGTDPLGQINFELGAINGATAGTVTFDNIQFYRNFNAQE